MEAEKSYMVKAFTAMSSASARAPSGVPTANRLAFYRMDQSMVTDYPQVDIPEIGYFDHPETQSLHRYSRSRQISDGWRDLSSR